MFRLTIIDLFFTHFRILWFGRSRVFMRAEFDKNKNVDPETAARLVAEGEKKVASQRSDLLWQCKFVIHYHETSQILTLGKNCGNYWIRLKFEQWFFEMANSIDPELSGTVWSGSTLFVQICVQMFRIIYGVLHAIRHPVIFRHEHPSILREAFLAKYRYVNVCKCKLISREHFRQILINNFIAVSLGKTNTCIWLNIGRKLEKYDHISSWRLVIK